MRHSRTLVCAAVLAALSATAGAQAPAPLRDAARKAVVSNPEVQERWHAFRAAEEEQGVARGSFLPQGDLLAAVGRERLKQPGAGTDSFTHRSLALSFNQLVYDGFFTRNEVSRLGYGKLARYYELVDASETAALEALRAYADVLRYRELVRLAQDNYVEHRHIHGQISERTEAGVGRRVDLDQASGRLALAESNLLTDASNLHDVTARYLRVVGEMPAAELPGLPRQLAADGIPATAGDALREAFNTNPSLNAAVENVRAGESLIEARRAAFHPRVDVRADYALDDNLEGLSGRTHARFIGLVMSYNLFRGGADQARLRQAMEARNQAKDLREKVCRDVRQTVSIAHHDVGRLEEQLAYLDQHQRSMEKARAAYRSQFEIGQRTLLDLLDSENEYFQARRAYVNASYDQLIAQARMLAAMGRLMSTLDVAREDLPSPGDIGQDRGGIDPASVCPPQAPMPMTIDKEALLREAMATGRRAGQAR